MYQQDFNPVSDSLGLTAIFAALPLICLFVLLGGFKMKAQWAALIALGVSMLVALIVYSMPVGRTALSAGEGAAFGIFPIMWVVVTAIWVYNSKNLAIGAAAVGLTGSEGDLFRKVLGWSLVLILAMCVLVYLQSTAVLDWMVVK